jgi:RimJ/RimL family protein N-acetyltransferase
LTSEPQIIDAVATEIMTERRDLPDTAGPEADAGPPTGMPDLARAMVLDGLLYGADAHVATWVQERLGGELVKVPFVAFGVIEDNRLVAGAYYHSWHDNNEQRDIMIAVAIDDAALKPETIARFLDYAFGQLKLPRITAQFSMANERAVQQAMKLGFKLEGRKRKCTPDGGDVGVFGLLADECKIWQRHLKKS